MKKTIIFLIVLFIIYTIVVNSCPFVSQWDINAVKFVQNMMQNAPEPIFYLTGSVAYSVFLIIPLIVGILYFLRKYLIIDLILFSSIPLVAFIFNAIFKEIIKRPRPPMELQILTHSANFSYVSSHTFITASLWGLVIYYLCKYCENKFLKISGILFAIFWILFEGFSRVWLGVHNPTDVFGGYLLAIILVLIYIKMIKIIGGK